ncbi:MAG: hypothetical protein HY781_06205 [Chloroflexi bacterium]|nr:hypothetical protein [Chloroflexota bacterium]
MLHSGGRHRLVLYIHILNRWWRIIFGIGAIMLTLALGLGYLPRFLAENIAYDVPESSVWMVGSVGAFAVLLAIFLVTIRKSAYVQPFDNHLRLVTPFLRLKISYRRIRQASSMEMARLFPLVQYKRKRAILRPLIKSTAIVLDLNGLPLSRTALSLFLSPLFFPDKTPRLALLVPDWIKFSTELESFRSAWMESQRQPEKDPRLALLSSISKAKR